MNTYNCASSSNITIDFKDELGTSKHYLIKYRRADTLDEFTEVVVSSLPHILQSVPNCFGLEISVQGDCGFGWGKPIVVKTNVFVKVSSMENSFPQEYTCKDNRKLSIGAYTTEYYAEFFSDPKCTNPIRVSNLQLIISTARDTSDPEYNSSPIRKQVILCSGTSAKIGSFSIITDLVGINEEQQSAICNTSTRVEGGIPTVEPGNNYLLVL